jgi:hypothetical protein
MTRCTRCCIYDNRARSAAVSGSTEIRGRVGECDERTTAGCLMASSTRWTGSASQTPVPAAQAALHAGAAPSPPVPQSSSPRQATAAEAGGSQGGVLSITTSLGPRRVVSPVTAPGTGQDEKPDRPTWSNPACQCRKYRSCQQTGHGCATSRATALLPSGVVDAGGGHFPPCGQCRTQLPGYRSWMDSGELAGPLRVFRVWNRCEKAATSAGCAGPASSTLCTWLFTVCTAMSSRSRSPCCQPSPSRSMTRAP